jgi:hypothetical protein
MRTDRLGAWPRPGIWPWRFARGAVGADGPCDDNAADVAGLLSERGPSRMKATPEGVADTLGDGWTGRAQSVTAPLAPRPSGTSMSGCWPDSQRSEPPTCARSTTPASPEKEGRGTLLDLAREGSVERTSVSPAPHPHSGQPLEVLRSRSAAVPSRSDAGPTSNGASVTTSSVRPGAPCGAVAIALAWRTGWRGRGFR